VITTDISTRSSLQNQTAKNKATFFGFDRYSINLGSGSIFLIILVDV
jgi:hypothetical protein